MTLIWGNIDHSRFALISHDVYLAHILPFIPQNDLEELVLRAVETNNIEDLYFLIGTTSATVPKYLSSNKVISKAAGFTKILPVLHQLGFALSEEIFSAAAKRGSLRIMKWLKANACPWDEHTFGEAAIYGDLETMKWLKDNQCPWNERTFLAAAKQGSITNMKWLKENSCPWDQRTFWESAAQGNILILDWLKESGCPIGNMISGF
jgi:hypothetical protein